MERGQTSHDQTYERLPKAVLCILAHRLFCAFVCAANGDLLAVVETSDAALLRARQMSTRKDAGEFFGTSAPRHRPPDDGFVETEIATFDRFWQCPFLGTGLSCIQTSDIGAPRAEDVDFVVIQTHLPFVFDRTQNNQAFHVDTAAARSSAGVR